MKLDARMKQTIARAIRNRQSEREHRHACGSCGRKAALLIISFEGLRIGAMCRFCEASYFKASDRK